MICSPTPKRLNRIVGLWGFRSLKVPASETLNRSKLLLNKPFQGRRVELAKPKNLEITTMKNDPIVDEVRNNGLALAARCNNNLEAIWHLPCLHKIIANSRRPLETGVVHY